MDLGLLATTLTELGQPADRARQVCEWTVRGVPGYEGMTNLPEDLRRDVAELVPFTTLSVEAESRARDGTIKALFRRHDGHPVEAVLMRHRDGRRSICLSSQSGCPLTCSFCATGQMRFGRNLTASEILDQALHFRRLGEVHHTVFMGMGEPMLNLDWVLEAARRLPDVVHRTAPGGGLDRRLASRAAPLRGRGPGAGPARALPPRRRGRALLPVDAGQRALPAS
jgi:23S rRNA (adenine2503-C2)-methyltransferase